MTIVYHRMYDSVDAPRMRILVYSLAPRGAESVGVSDAASMLLLEDLGYE